MRVPFVRMPRRPVQPQIKVGADYARSCALLQGAGGFRRSTRVCVFPVCTDGGSAAHWRPFFVVLVFTEFVGCDLRRNHGALRFVQVATVEFFFEIT